MFPHPRKHVRYPIRFPVRVQSRATASNVGQGVASTNLSVQGIGILLDESSIFVSGEPVEVTLAVEEETESELGRDILLQIKFEAKIAWMQGKQCGLEITKLAGEDLALYENLLTALGHSA